MLTDPLPVTSVLMESQQTALFLPANTEEYTEEFVDNVDDTDTCPTHSLIDVKVT